MQKLPGALFLAAEIALVAQSPPAPTFRSRTELVQVSVIATDKKGNPVVDLRQDEFQIFDNGMAREVRLFAADSPASGPQARETRQPGIFTNRIATPAGLHSGYSVILIDELFTDSDPDFEEGTSLARTRALEALRSIRAGEQIAIYVLDRPFRVICDFTSDRAMLERQLAKWKVRATTPQSIIAFNTPQPSNILMRGPAAAPPAGPTGDQAAAADDAAGRAQAEDAEIGAIADHLAGIPERKNLIYLSNRFVIGGRSIQRLSRAGVSIYPVDLDGVCRLCPPRPTILMDQIAAVTGGIAFYQRNDLASIIREAVDDGRASYTLGFYASDNAPTPVPHKLVVKVSRPGVSVRYRTAYQLEENHPADANPAAGFIEALNRPIDVTSIPIQASVSRARDRLNIEASLDPQSLDLAHQDDLWKGRIQVVARFTTAEGRFASNAFAQTVTFNLSQASWNRATKGGITWHNEFTIPAGAVQLKLLFANPDTRKAGTLTIPLSQVPAAK